MRQSKKQKQLREFIEQSKQTAHTPAEAKELEDMGRGRVNNKSVDNGGKSGIIKKTEMFRKKGKQESDYHYIDKQRIDQLMIEAKKNGAEILIDERRENKSSFK